MKNQKTTISLSADLHEMNLNELRKLAAKANLKKIFSFNKENLISELDRIKEQPQAQTLRPKRVQARVKTADTELPITKRIQTVLDRKVTKTEKFKLLRKQGLRPIEISKVTDSNYSFVYSVLTKKQGIQS